MTANRDSSAKDEINEAKEEFYTKYSYLKPDCEKSTWERIKDGIKSACEWCKKHWKEIVAVILIIAAVVVVIVTAGAALGPIMGIVAATAKAVLLGAAIGGVIGGISGYAQNGVGGILNGIIGGATNGAIMGAVFGLIGGAGALAGSFFGCSAFMEGLFVVSSKLSLGMMAFDIAALGDAFMMRLSKDLHFDYGGGQIAAANAKAHENPFYNALQMGAGATAAFSGGYVSNSACFVAGTLIATANGLVAIENINIGDSVLSADPETMQKKYMRVLDSFVRKVDKLTHLTINDEIIITTSDHPFYVNGQGFVPAGALCIGSELVDASGNVCCVENIFHEQLQGEKRTVYNFKVDEYHTYFVGKNSIFVHNATCTPENREHVKEHLDGTASNTGARRNGAINGCHEESVFLDELQASGGDLVNVTPVEGMEGVNVVEYRTASGNIKTKTVYDSDIISTEQYLDRGMEALSNVPGDLSGIPTGTQTATDSSGVSWNIFIRDHEVITMYPTNP